MSYYYNYYIGYELDGKIYPWGPYNAKGNLLPVFSRSRSFASDLWRDFIVVDKDEVSEELREKFEYEDWNGQRTIEVKYLPVKDLPNDSFIKTGYFLIENVHDYLHDKDNFNEFYDVLTPEIYVVKLQNEIIFGKKEPKKDVEGNIIEEHSASDYTYFAYPDYYSKEYESFILKEAVEMLDEYSFKGNYVILETEG